MSAADPTAMTGYRDGKNYAGCSVLAKNGTLGLRWRGEGCDRSRATGLDDTGAATLLPRAHRGTRGRRSGEDTGPALEKYQPPTRPPAPFSLRMHRRCARRPSSTPSTPQDPQPGYVYISPHGQTDL